MCIRDRSKCELIQTLMRERAPQQLLQKLAEDGHSTPSQVVVFMRQPDEAVLERFFAGDPSCQGSAFKVVHDLTGEGVVLFLRGQADGYVYDAQRASADRMSLGGDAKGAVRKREGVWAASSI